MSAHSKESMMIRFITGLFIVFGAVGGMDADPHASLLTGLLLAFAGLALMAWPILDGTVVDPQLRRR